MITVPMPQGKMVSGDGNEYVDKFPPGYVIANDFGGSGVTNSTTQTSLLSAAVTNGFPAMVTAGDTIEVFISGHLLNTAAAQTMQLDLYSGSTSLATFTTGPVASNANGRHFQVTYRAVFKTSGGAGAGVIRTVASGLVFGTGNTSTFQSIVTGASQGTDYVDTTLATNVAANLDVKATLSAATATTSAIAYLAQVRYYPMNR